MGRDLVELLLVSLEERGPLRGKEGWGGRGERGKRKGGARDLVNESGYFGDEWEQLFCGWQHFPRTSWPFWFDRSPLWLPHRLQQAGLALVMEMGSRLWIRQPLVDTRHFAKA